MFLFASWEFYEIPHLSIEQVFAKDPYSSEWEVERSEDHLFWFSKEGEGN